VIPAGGGRGLRTEWVGGSTSPDDLANNRGSQPGEGDVPFPNLHQHGCRLSFQDRMPGPGGAAPEASDSCSDTRQRPVAGQGRGVAPARSGAERSLAAALDAAGRARWHAVAEPCLKPARPEARSDTRMLRKAQPARVSPCFRGRTRGSWQRRIDTWTGALCTWLLGRRRLSVAIKNCPLTANLCPVAASTLGGGVGPRSAASRTGSARPPS
jgi:hypothetical protein